MKESWQDIFLGLGLLILWIFLYLVPVLGCIEFREFLRDPLIFFCQN